MTLMATLLFIGKIILTIFYESRHVLCDIPDYSYRGTCDSLDCATYSGQLWFRMNQSINPCNDFYKYVCGNANNQDTELRRLYKDANKIRSYIGTEINDFDTEPTRKFKTLFETCLNISEHLQPVLNKIKRLGGWPDVLDKNWNNTYVTWENYFEFFTREDLIPDHFFRIKIETNRVEVKDYYILIEATKYAEFKSTEEDNHKNELRRMIYALFSDILKSFNVTDSNLIASAIEDYVSFTNSMICATRKQAKSTVMKLEELETEIKGIPWLNVFKAALNPIEIIRNKTIKPNTTHYLYAEDIYIRVGCPSCIKCMIVVVERTPKRKLVNYVMFQTVIKGIPHFHEVFRRRLYEIQMLLEGSYSPDSDTKFRPNFCIRKLIEKCLKWHHDYNYLTTNSLFPVKEPVTFISNNIRKYLLNIVNLTTWLDKATRKIAVDKVKSIHFKLAYPDYLKPENVRRWFDKPLEDLDLRNPENYWNAVLILNRIQNTRKIFNFLERRPAREEWKTSITKPRTTFFDATDNSFTIPIIFLLPNIFKLERPFYLNYASTGYLIGHTVMHSIIGNGIQFTKDGIREPWMLSQYNFTYHNRRECFVNQYEDWASNHLNMPSVEENLINENMVEAEGVLLAYKAFVKYIINENLQAPALSNAFSKFNIRKMFWIQYASLWCHSEDLGVVSTINYEENLPFIRVWNVVVNSKEFANDWNCTKEDPMNPLHKCSMYFK